MRYSGSLVKVERENVFELFLTKSKLKFNEIEKALKIRSNMVSYHLNRMIKDGLLTKEGEYYMLTREGERYIPIFSNVTGKELAGTPVALVAVLHGKKMLLIKREKRPFKGYWSLLGGKIRLEESIKDASIRLAKDKAGLEVIFISLNTLYHERVLENNIVKHSFMQFFCKAMAETTKLRSGVDGELRWFTMQELSKLKIVPSDLWLLRKKMDSRMTLVNVFMEEKAGEIVDFKLAKNT